MKNTTLERIIKDGVLLILVGVTIVVTQLIYDFLCASFNIVDASNVISMLVAVLITFLVYKTYDKKIVGVLNKTFFRKRHLGRIQIAQLNEEIIGMLDVNKLSSLLVERVLAIFEIEHVALFVWNDEQQQFCLGEHAGLDIPTQFHVIKPDEGIIQSLYRNRRHIFYKRSYHSLSWDEAVEVDGYFERFAAKVVIPFFHEDTLLAFLSLGEAEKIRRFQQDIGDFYYSLSKYAGKALHNALEYQKILGNMDESRDSQSALLQRLKIEAIDKLATGVAHEIRNPLTIISLKAQNLKRKNQNGLNKEEIDNALDLFAHQIKRASEISSRLISFSQKDGNVTEVNVGRLIEEMIDVLSYQVSQKNIKVIKFIDSTMPLFKGSLSELRELFLNLMLNAIEAQSDEGGTICVYISYLRVQKKFVFHIVDDSKVARVVDETSDVLNPFYTLKDGKKPGLGLYICQQIVTKYEGTIRFNNNSPHGA
ncbi:sensor histidine kinase, partial [Candidatus Omnitrophota bacterium]